MDHSKDGRRLPPGLDCACKLFVLSVLVLQNSSLVLATTYSRQREGPLYLTTMLVCLGECIKTSVSIVLTLVGYGRSTGRVLHQHFYVEARSLWRMAVPALLYTVSNNLALVAMSNLSAVAYQVANQLKIPATALMSRLLLQRRISRLQYAGNKMRAKQRENKDTQNGGADASPMRNRTKAKDAPPVPDVAKAMAAVYFSYESEPAPAAEDPMAAAAAAYGGGNIDDMVDLS